MSNLPKSLSAFDLHEWLISERDQPTIIDVRENYELEIVKFPFYFLHMPISKITFDYVHEKLNTIENKRVVVSCHMGVRSLHFSQWLLDNNFLQEIWNLEEGIDGWSKYIDSGMVRY
ncbi:MAG: rhodanese [Euryarchaeota archaeon]|nr:rhodanese [Euryarchaeota archaeon]